MQLSLQIVGRTALPGLRAEWNALLANMEYATPFATWEWAQAWLQTIGRDTEACIVLARRGDALAGILPLARQHGALPVLPLLATGQVYPDHLSLLAAPADVAQLLPVMLRAAFAAAGGSARIDLPFIARGSAMDAACQRAAAGLRCAKREAGMAPYLPIRGSHAEFLAGLSSNERYKIRNRTRKLLVNQGASYGAVAGMTPVAVLGRLRELHAARAAQKGIESSFDLDAVQDFHRHLLGLLPADQLMFRCLSSERDIFALFYGFRLQNRVFYFQLGYDPEWAEHSPGIVLLSEVIREAHELGCDEFNFLQGDESFKQTWTRQQRALEDWSFFAPGVTGGMRRSVESGIAWSKRCVRRALPGRRSRTDAGGK